MYTKLPQTSKHYKQSSLHSSVLVIVGVPFSVLSFRGFVLVRRPQLPWLPPRGARVRPSGRWPQGQPGPRPHPARLSGARASRPWRAQVLRRGGGPQSPRGRLSGGGDLTASLSRSAVGVDAGGGRRNLAAQRSSLSACCSSSSCEGASSSASASRNMESTRDHIRSFPLLSQDFAHVHAPSRAPGV